MEEECVAILLAAYKGEEYIAQQIDSILAQSYKNWHLWIRVDSSSDQTEQIVSEYARQHSRIYVLDNQGLRMGAKLNFGALMFEISRHPYEYIMFSDQDDVWSNNKVENSLASIQMEYANCKENTPLLIHTDFQYADVSLNPLNVRSNVAIKLSTVHNKLALIANDNYIFGCTMIINKALLLRSIPVSVDADNHDYWIALHAAAFGRITYLDQKTMVYRQHHNNVSGGVKYSSFRNRLARLTDFSSYIIGKNKRREQFRAFFNKEVDCISIDQKLVLKRYLYYSDKGGFRAVIFMISHGFKLRGPLQTLMYYMSLLLDVK